MTQQLRYPIGLLFDLFLPVLSAMFLGLIFHERLYTGPLLPQLFPNDSSGACPPSGTKIKLCAQKSTCSCTKTQYHKTFSFAIYLYVLSMVVRCFTDVLFCSGVIIPGNNTQVCTFLLIPADDPFLPAASLTSMAVGLAAVASSMRVFGAETIIFKREVSTTLLCVTSFRNSLFLMALRPSSSSVR